VEEWRAANLKTGSRGRLFKPFSLCREKKNGGESGILLRAFSQLRKNIEENAIQAIFMRPSEASGRESLGV
jgi:hypothetical protein